jgi:aspartyl protease family protein
VFAQSSKPIFDSLRIPKGHRAKILGLLGVGSMFKQMAGTCLMLMLAMWFGAGYLEKKADAPPVSTAAVSRETAKPAKEPGQKASPSNIVVLESDGRGHFLVEIEARGIHFPAMVDTGASMVAIPESLGRKLGYFPSEGEYTHQVKTANGIVRVASVVLPQVRLRGLVAYNVEAAILPDSSLGGVLLGMSFLRKMKSFSIKDDRLTLTN